MSNRKHYIPHNCRTLTLYLSTQDTYNLDHSRWSRYCHHLLGSFTQLNWYSEYLEGHVHQVCTSYQRYSLSVLVDISTWARDWMQHMYYVGSYQSTPSAMHLKHTTDNAISEIVSELTLPRRLSFHFPSRANSIFAVLGLRLTFYKRYIWKSMYNTW